MANGFFTITQSNLGINDGLVLTTGTASAISGFAQTLASANNNAPGDPQLNTLANTNTYDACILVFDFVPAGDTVKFDYVFGSEEYNNATCGPYNDAFAFFISGPGISGQDNMALVTSTNIPVMVNTVNSGVPGTANCDISNCTSIGPGSPFTQYYVDNTTGVTITYRGFTTVFTAQHAVAPCNSYHLKLTIADGGNATYDSGVFLKSGSLQANSYHIVASAPIDTVRHLPFCVKGCSPATITVKRPQVRSFSETLKLIKGGTAVEGIDYTALPDSATIPAFDTAVNFTVNGLATPLNGVKQLTVYLQSPVNCVGITNITDSASLLIYDTTHISMVTPDTVLCANYPLDLMVAGDGIYSYSWQPVTGLSNANIQNPVATPAGNIVYTVTATLPGTNCPAKTALINIGVKTTPVIILPADMHVCNSSALLLAPIISPVGGSYSYEWITHTGNFYSDSIIIPNASVKNQGNYTLIVTNDANACAAEDSVMVYVDTVAKPVVTEPIIFCLGYTATQLTAKGEALKWYGAPKDSAYAAAPIPSTTNLGSQQYFVTQTVNGCESEKESVDVEVKKCCDGVIFIPSAFTPNGDDKNDKFMVKYDYGYQLSYLRIFNKWGQMVFDGFGDIGWDGTYGHAPAEVGTYYYEASFKCINGGKVERKGDLILIR